MPAVPLTATYHCVPSQVRAASAAADVQMSFPVEAAAARGGDLSAYPKLREFLQRIHARPAYKKALELNPNYLEAHANLAMLYERMGKKEQAIYHWMKKGRVPLIRAAKIEELYGTPARDLIDPAIVRALSSDIL